MKKRKKFDGFDHCFYMVCFLQFYIKLFLSVTDTFGFSCNFIQGGIVHAIDRSSTCFAIIV